MKLYVKYMVSIRCKMIVRDQLQALGIAYSNIALGEVDIDKPLDSAQRLQLDMALRQYGLELLEGKKAILIGKIKSVMVEYVHYTDELPKEKFSKHLSEKLKYDYTYLSNLFSETEGTTIEHSLIVHKIERVKELIIYDQLNMTEIADKLRYSSVAHLSNQFKKITGLTPSYFKKLKDKKRVGLENL